MNVTHGATKLAVNTAGGAVAGTMNVTHGAVSAVSTIEASVIKTATAPAVLSLNVLGLSSGTDAQATHAQGDVSVSSGSTSLGTFTLANGGTSVDLSALGHGVHILTISYGGGQGLQASSTVVTVVL
jgi:hypothetical protein